MNVDYLIVGQGLTGSVAALLLDEQGHDVVFANVPDLSRCSWCAAGIYNPITGKRFVLSPTFAERWSMGEAFYRRAQLRLGVPVLHERRFLRLLRSDAERRVAEDRLRDAAYRAWTGRLVEAEDVPAAVIAPLGALEVNGAGFLDLPAFLGAVRQRFRVVERRFVFDECRLTDTGVLWEGVHARRLLFCEGHLGAQNGLFPEVEFKCAKGELLTVAIDGLASDQILHRGIYLLPLGGDRFRAGATYDWDELDDRPTDAGRAAILEGLAAMTTRPVAVLDHGAGVRPVTRTREQVFRRHPDHPSIGFLNGMGARGVVHAPACCAEALAEWDR